MCFKSKGLGWLFWLTKLKINNNVKLKILRKVGGAEKLFNSSLDDLVYFEFNDKLIYKILDLRLREGLEKDYEYMIKNNIEIIGIEDEIYPDKLKIIDDNPIAFYIRGNKNILDRDGVRNSWFKKFIRWSSWSY